MAAGEGDSIPAARLTPIMRTPTNDEIIRQHALDKAIDSFDHVPDTEAVLARAESFRQFLSGDRLVWPFTNHHLGGWLR